MFSLHWISFKKNNMRYCSCSLKFWFSVLSFLYVMELVFSIKIGKWKEFNKVSLYTRIKPLHFCLKQIPLLLVFLHAIASRTMTWPIHSFQLFYWSTYCSVSVKLGRSLFFFKPTEVWSLSSSQKVSCLLT